MLSRNADSFILTGELAGVRFQPIRRSTLTKNLSQCLDNSFPETLDLRMKLYSIAAAAAGVGMLALAQPVTAEVIITKKHIPINAGSPVSIDLNRDGIPDFEFSATTFRTHPSSHLNVKLVAEGLTGGELVGGHLGSLPGAYAAALLRGAKIGFWLIFLVCVVRLRSSDSVPTPQGRVAATETGRIMLGRTFFLV